ncbi:MAG: hypothetical protein QW165_04515 [Candidatus Woesearchaeota archaeon]
MNNNNMRPLSEAQESAVRRKLEQTFTQKEAQILSSIGIRKTFLFFTSLARRLCNLCRVKMQHNPRMNIQEYCPTCQELCTAEIKKFIAENQP